MCGTFERLIIQTFSSYIISVNIIPTVLTVQFIYWLLWLWQMFSKDPTLQSLKVTPVLLLVWLPLFFVHTESVESMDGPFTGEYMFNIARKLVPLL